MNKYLKYTLIGIVVIILVVLFVVMQKNYQKFTDNDLKIYFFNAGKADACIITKNNKHMMIDTGEEDLSEEILQYFKDNDIKEIDYLIITHFDKDHVGSASTIIDNIKVNNIFQSDYEKESNVVNKYIDSIDKKGIAPKTIKGDYEFEFEDLKIVVNGPQETFDNNESNNSSLITTIKYNDNGFIFTGDAQNARIKEYLKNNNEHFDFIKIPYHGNHLKQLNNLLEVIKPKYAVITSSNKEKEDEETTNTLRNLNIKYYLTREGAITIKSNGHYIKIEQ